MWLQLTSLTSPTGKDCGGDTDNRYSRTGVLESWEAYNHDSCHALLHDSILPQLNCTRHLMVLSNGFIFIFHYLYKTETLHHFQWNYFKYMVICTYVILFPPLLCKDLFRFQQDQDDMKTVFSLLQVVMVTATH